MMSLKNINIISGQVACNAQLMLSLALRNGVTYEVKEESDTGAKIEFRRGDMSYVSEFSKKDAEAAGLTGKDNWKKYPKDMYFWRCVAKGIRRVAPDAVMGLYTPDEITEGKYIDVIDVPPEPDKMQTPLSELAKTVAEPTGDKVVDMQKEIGSWLCEMYGGIVQAEKQLELLTAWTNKEGKEFAGKKSVFDLAVKPNAKGATQTSVIHHKVQEMYEEWKATEAGDGIHEPA
jgi:hypothetical protein